MRNTAFPRLAAMAAAALVSLPLWAQAPARPTFAGPSMVRASDVAVFSGRGYAANGALSISVTAPGGAEAVFGTVAGDDGTLTTRVAPRGTGAHTVKVLDAGGRVLARVVLIAME